MTPLGAARADLDAVEAIVRAAGTSFYRGMAVLPPDRRHAMYAIYAFCRIVDDIVDEEGPFADKVPLLAAWRARIRVAASVGRLSVRAFGDASPDADRVAHALGRALQLTNILRDVAEDAERGRLYLPREYLDAEGVPRDPRAALAHPALGRVCARLAELAHVHFRAARTAMEACDRRAMKPARLMGATYGAILSRLEATGWADPTCRVGLAKWQKLWLVLRYGLV